MSIIQGTEWQAENYQAGPQEVFERATTGRLRRTVRVIWWNVLIGVLKI